MATSYREIPIETTEEDDTEDSTNNQEVSIDDSYEIINAPVIIYH